NAVRGVGAARAGSRGPSPVWPQLSPVSPARVVLKPASTGAFAAGRSSISLSLRVVNAVLCLNAALSWIAAARRRYREPELLAQNCRGFRESAEPVRGRPKRFLLLE